MKAAAINRSRLKVAIVGCGKIADSHAAQLQRVPDCDIVGVCDREPLMARQFHERFPVQGYYNSLEELFKKAQPDVVHVTTPPQSHYALGKQCLEEGCHVYIEKPFTLHAWETDELLALAEQRNLCVTAGHDDQFRHAARRMRRLVTDGYLGGPPVHMESYYCYELGETSGYAQALLSDKKHWVRSLPGGLLHNIISHGIARIAEYMPDELPEIQVRGFVSPLLRRLGEEEIIDELRVILCAEERVTAYFTFSSQMRPSLHQFRLFGSKNGLELDQDHETLIRLRGGRHKSYLEQFVPPLTFACDYLGNLTRNLGMFLARDFHMKSGMKFLIESFYQSIRGEAPLPIPHREIRLTAHIMEAIFNQMQRPPIETDPS